MEDVISQIKTYVLIIDSTITDNDLLDFVIADVVDRALIYTNRKQFVPQYEDDLVTYDPAVSANDDFWAYYEHYPIPEELERTLASSVVGALKTILARNTATKGAVHSVSDHGQSVTYKDTVQSFMTSSSDTELFAGAKEMLDKFRTPTVVANFG